MGQISDCVNRLAASATFAMMQKSNELAAQGVNVVNMSVGEPDFNTPDYVKTAAKQAIDDNYSTYSPVPGYMSLRKACSDKLLCSYPDCGFYRSKAVFMQRNNGCC